MWRYLGRRFWVSVTLLGMTVFALSQGPRFFRAPARKLVLADEIPMIQARPETPSPVTGLTPGVEARLSAYLDSFVRGPDGHDWRLLHEDWLGLVRQWFERIFPEPTTYDRYVRLWLDKRVGARQLRRDLRQRFFPDLNDEELVARADWLNGQEEWQEMQLRVQRGLEEIEARYQEGLEQLLGPYQTPFLKLHRLYLEEQLLQSAAPATFFI